MMNKEMMMSYIKLVKARDSELAAEIMDYDGADTELLDMYVAAEDADGEPVYKDRLGKVEIMEVEVVAVIGGINDCRYGIGARCYANTVTAYRDAAGSLWLAESMFEEAFC